MKEIIRKLAASLDTITKDGYSARKLSAFIIMVCAVAAHAVWLKHAYKTEDFSLLGELLIIDFSFVGALLGMTTWEALKRKEPPQNEPAA